eukprot:COSAG01_NODE_1745_length_9351_cov_206.635470_2_plen_89_part_00
MPWELVICEKLPDGKNAAMPKSTAAFLNGLAILRARCCMVSYDGLEMRDASHPFPDTLPPHELRLRGSSYFYGAGTGAHSQPPAWWPS